MAQHVSSNSDSLPAPVSVDPRYERGDDDLESLLVLGNMTDGVSDPGSDEDAGEEEVERQIKQDLVFAEQQRVGPLLAELRSQQAEGLAGNRESYGVEHLRRLYQFVPKRPYRKPVGPKQYCSKVHEKPCHECVTCHFCRQRTTERKTSCSKCAGVNSYFGGPGRGIWCGSCLQGRIGENIHEVLENPDWICPCCRDICNCSGVNCMRLKRGWFPTNQLSREASEQGYKSVAHYLILTHLSEHASVEDIGAGLVNARRTRRLGHENRRRQGNGVRKRRFSRGSLPMAGSHGATAVNITDLEDSETDDEANENTGDGGHHAGVLRQQARFKSAQTQLPLQFQGMKTRRDALELASKPRLEREITNILKDLNRKGSGPSLDDGIGGETSRFGESARFLCLLDEDDCDEEEDEGAATWEGPNGGFLVADAAADRVTGAEYRKMHPSACPVTIAADTGGKTSGAGQQSSAAVRDPPLPMVSSIAHAPGYVPNIMNTVSITGTGRKKPGMRVCEKMLPPRRPKTKRRRRETEANFHGDTARGTYMERTRGNGSFDVNKAGRVSSRQHPPANVATDTEQGPGARHDLSGDDLSGDDLSEDDLSEDDLSEDDLAEDDIFASNDVGHIHELPSNMDGNDGDSGRCNQSLAGPRPVSQGHPSLPPPPHQQGVPLDEFVWNGLCLRATSVVDAVKTFYQFHPDVADSKCLQGADADRMLYDDMYESTRSGLQRVLKSAEGLLTQEAIVYYQSTTGAYPTEDVVNSVAQDKRQISTVGGLRRAVQLFSYLSRILPEEDVVWRIEKRLLGMEPFADFAASSPHAKAVLLRGWLEFVTIMEKRGMGSVDALTKIGNALGTIASEMRAALPLLDAIIESSPMPTRDVAISGWSYNEAARGKKLIDVFTDLSVLYASLHEIFLVGIQRAIETSVILGLKSHHMLTKPLVRTLLDPLSSFPARVVRQGLVFICTIIDIALKSYDDEGMGMTAQERNALVRDRNQLLDLIESVVTPDLEALVQQDYHMWGSKNSRKCLNNNGDAGKQGIGSEKVEVLARCYALLLRAGRAPWVAIESKATEPYSFSQYWKYVNLRYRHFSLYLLAHALERAPLVLSSQGRPALPVTTILRMWLLAVLDFGRHECAWYLTNTISKHTSFLPTLVDFRGDKSGEKAATVLAGFARSISGNQALIRGVVLSLDECLQERQREIVQTAFHADRAVLQWHRTTSRVLLAFLCELQGDLRRERELLRLLRRCVIWSIQDLSTLKAAAEVEDGFDSPLDGLRHLGIGGQGPLGPESVEGDLRQALDMFEFDRLVTMLPRALDDEIEFHEPLWIFISGIIGLGDASADGTPFERVMNDRVAASLFAPAHQSNPSALHGLPLHRHVLGTHIRRILTKTNFFNSQNEKMGVSAVRFVRAVLSRPEMRAAPAFETVFDMMITTWIDILSRTSPTSDSLAVRFELLEFLKDSIKVHGDILASSYLHREFWKVICCECLRMVSAQFPEGVWSSIAMEAQFIFYHVVQKFPEMESFAPSTPEMLSSAYNNALSEVGRPPSFDVLDSVASTHNLADILPRVYGSRQREGSLRPGDFAWSLAKASISLVVAMLDVGAEGETLVTAGNGSVPSTVTTDGPFVVTQGSKPGLWYPLCCLPYLESVARKGERAYLLIKKECETLFARLESRAPGVLAILPAKQDQSAQLTATASQTTRFTQSLEKCPADDMKDGTGRKASTRQPPREVLRTVDDVKRLEMNTKFAFLGKITKIRAMDRNGSNVAACTLLSENYASKSDVPRELSILVSKPENLVMSLLDPFGPSGPSKLPTNALFRNIELVKLEKPVARSTSSTTIEFRKEAGPDAPESAASVIAGSGGESGRGSRPASTVFVEASKDLVRMGYSLDLITTCLRDLQKHPRALTKEMIVNRVLSMLNG